MAKTDSIKENMICIGDDPGANNGHGQNIANIRRRHLSLTRKPIFYCEFRQYVLKYKIRHVQGETYVTSVAKYLG